MSRKLRFLKAYRSVFTVLCSYLLLGFQKKILGEGWARERAPAVHRRNARRIERTILELKGLFIKVGQMLSIMSNFLPEDLTQGLEGLQDSVPPHPYEAIEKRFQEEFQKSPRELYARFEETPIASASLGQVHVAYLQDGTKVAVKVQYPEIDEVVRSDLKTLRRIFWLLHLFFPAYGLKNVYGEIAEVILRELDYSYEGKNLELLKKNFEGEKDFLFPDVFWDRSSAKILTLRFMEGAKISAVDELKKQGIDAGVVARRIIHAYCKQIFIDGIYHADPHPGNLLVQAAEGGFKIVLVDFGATARISDRMRHGITLFAEGVIKRDTRVLANAMREMGFIARPDSFEPFEHLVDYFYEKLSNIKIENFRQLDLSQLSHLEDLLELRKIKISFRDLMTSFHVPKDWILLERTLILIMGLCAILDPKLNPIEIVLPYVEKFVLKDKTLSEVAIAISKQLLLSYIQLPGEIQKTLRRLNDGTLKLQIKGQEDHTRRLYVLGHQILYAGLGVAGLFLSVHWRQAGFVDDSNYALYGSIFFGAVLGISFLRNRA
ncbi:MAG TPA: AarF/UbiB family protein [bacterium]|nr:AarF/UbiB family protein [bacterium]